MNATEQKIRHWVSNLPEKENQNQFYCCYWAEPGPDDTISTSPVCLRFFRTKEQIVSYLLDANMFNNPEDVMFFEESHDDTGWDVFIDEIEE